jgi:integrase
VVSMAILNYLSYSKTQQNTERNHEGNTMARKITGYLHKRGKKQYYYLEYTLNGKRIRIALRDEDDKPITNETKAKAARDRELASVRATDEAQRREMVVKALETAQERADKLTAEIDRISLSKSWQAYFDDPTRPRSGEHLLEDYERRWKRFVDWFAIDSQDVEVIDDIDEAAVKRFAKHLDLDGISNNRFNKIMQGCRLVYKTLVSGPNPFTIIPSRDLNTKSHRELSVAELKQVCGSAQGELRILLAVGLYTALRLKDACLLKWESVNLKNNLLTIVPSKTKRKGKILKIPVHDVLKSILQETPAEERKGFIAPGFAAQYSRNNSVVCRKLKRHFKAAGIETQERHEDQKNATCVVGFHSLRHSFVSLAADKGVPLSVVQELCGHGSPAIQKHYIHVGRDAAENAVAALPSLEESPAMAKERGVRDELRALADSLPIEVARKVLAMAKQELEA